MAVRRFPAMLVWLPALILGGGSLLLFGWFLVVGPVTGVRLEMSPLWALLWDAGLSLGFFIQHSGMVRQSFQDWLQRRHVARSLHPSIYAIVSGVVLAGVVMLWQPTATVVWSADEHMRFMLRAVTVLIAIFFAWGVLALDEFDTFGVKALRERLHRSEPKMPRLVVHGPYRWVRHPLYLGSILLIWTIPHVTTDRLLFNVLWSVWVGVAARWEERDLEKIYGSAYHHYQAMVPMLFPLRGPIDQDTIRWLERERGRRTEGGEGKPEDGYRRTEVRRRRTEV